MHRSPIKPLPTHVAPPTPSSSPTLSITPSAKGRASTASSSTTSFVSQRIPISPSTKGAVLSVSHCDGNEQPQQKEVEQMVAIPSSYDSETGSNTSLVFKIQPQVGPGDKVSSHTHNEKKPIQEEGKQAPSSSDASSSIEILEMGKTVRRKRFSTESTSSDDTDVSNVFIQVEAAGQQALTNLVNAATEQITHAVTLPTSTSIEAAPHNEEYFECVRESSLLRMGDFQEKSSAIKMLMQSQDEPLINPLIEESEARSATPKGSNKDKSPSKILKKGSPSPQRQKRFVDTPKKDIRRLRETTLLYAQEQRRMLSERAKTAEAKQIQKEIMNTPSRSETKFSTITHRAQLGYTPSLARFSPSRCVSPPVARVPTSELIRHTCLAHSSKCISSSNSLSQRRSVGYADKHLQRHTSQHSKQSEGPPSSIQNRATSNPHLPLNSSQEANNPKYKFPVKDGKGDGVPINLDYIMTKLDDVDAIIKRRCVSQSGQPSSRGSSQLSTNLAGAFSSTADLWLRTSATYQKAPSSEPDKGPSEALLSAQYYETENLLKRFSKGVRQPTPSPEEHVPVPRDKYPLPFQHTADSSTPLSASQVIQALQSDPSLATAVTNYMSLYKLNLRESVPNRTPSDESSATSAHFLSAISASPIITGDPTQ